MSLQTNNTNINKSSECNCCKKQSNGNIYCEECWDILKSSVRSGYNLILSRGRVKITLTPGSDIVKISRNADSKDNIIVNNEILLDEYTLFMDEVGMIGDIVLVVNDRVIQCVTPVYRGVISSLGDYTNRVIYSRFHMSLLSTTHEVFKPRVFMCNICDVEFHTHSSVTRKSNIVCADCWKKFRSIVISPSIVVRSRFIEHIIDIDPIRGRLEVYIHAKPNKEQLREIYRAFIDEYNYELQKQNVKFAKEYRIIPVEASEGDFQWEGITLHKHYPTYSVGVIFKPVI
jgi:protein-arginine kinase activator protein McsA